MGSQQFWTKNWEMRLDEKEEGSGRMKKKKTRKPERRWELPKKTWEERERLYIFFKDNNKLWECYGATFPNNKKI